jgi:hypothetical protein
MTRAVMVSTKLTLTGCLLWILVAPACGRQVDDEYLGEPLLSLRGQVTSAALTGGPGAVPALCFQHFTGDLSSRWDKLPADVIEALGEPNLDQASPYDLHIVDVEARGDFPAEFAIDVYVPPKPETLARLITGEPLSAFGYVCAVREDHAPIVRDLKTLGASVEEPGVMTTGVNARLNRVAS